MKKIAKIKVDRNLCIGSAPCVTMAPEVFDLDDEAKAVLKHKDGVKSSDAVFVSELEAPMDDEILLMAAQSCPTRAIFLYDEEGKQIYPEPEMTS